jgi:hypothetical protein
VTESFIFTAHRSKIVCPADMAIDPAGPGSYYMTTNFEIDAAIHVPGNYAVVAYVDRLAVASAALMLRIS